MDRLIDQRKHVSKYVNTEGSLRLIISESPRQRTGITGSRTETANCHDSDFNVDRSKILHELLRQPFYCEITRVIQGRLAIRELPSVKGWRY